MSAKVVPGRAADLPTVSVVIPLYNHEAYFGDAIRSALEQTHPPLEVIVVDDGSSDRSAEIAADWAKADPRVKVVCQENSGSHATINRGLSMAGGEWLAILNSDDAWTHSRLEVLLTAAYTHHSQFVFSSVDVIDGEGKKIRTGNDILDTQALLNERRRRKGLADAIAMGNLAITTSNFLFSRKAWQLLGTLQPYRYNLDWEYVLRASVHSELGLHYVEEPLLHYRWHDSNTIHSGMPVSALEALKIVSDYLRKHTTGKVKSGLVLAIRRNVRFLRRYLKNQIEIAHTNERIALEDRDRHVELIHLRQRQIESERQHRETELTSIRNTSQQQSGKIDALIDVIDTLSSHAKQDRLNAMEVATASSDKVVRHLEELQAKIEEIPAMLSESEHASTRITSVFAEKLTSGVDALSKQLEDLSNVHSSVVTSIQAQHGRERVELEARIVSLANEVETLKLEGRAKEDVIAAMQHTTVEGIARENSLSSQLHALDMQHKAARLESCNLRIRMSNVQDKMQERSMLNFFLRSKKSVAQTAPLFLGRSSSLGSVRQMSLATPVNAANLTVNAHLHLFYLDLAEELISYLGNIDRINRLVITGPWGKRDVAGIVKRLDGFCDEVRVVQLQNRGKDVGGFLHAVKHHALLDSDLVLKIHSKKSQNPETYFQAISHVFGCEIRDGDQWRRLLIDPLCGSQRQVSAVMHAFEADSSLGMIGAGSFITTAPDANQVLFESVCARLEVPQRLPFVAGTMFWARSAALMDLLAAGHDMVDFELDSSAVEGGLEHSYERVLGGLVQSRGFDLGAVHAS